VVKLAWFVIAGLAVARPASAGRSPFGWLSGTEVVPERGVELETWIQDLDNVGIAERDETELGWAATVGITDQLELSLPIELSWSRVGAVPGETSLDRWGAEARYRFASSDPVDAPALVPLLRVSVKREIDDRRAATVEGEAVLSYDCARVHAAASVSWRQTLHGGVDPIRVRPMAGVTVAITDALRVGVEAVSSFAAAGPGADWVAVGPDVAWTHGRFWLSASAPIGLSNVDAATRVRWGVAF
jgi:hypothetical protein